MIAYPPTPFGRSYWVVPNKLLAGSYPGAENTDEGILKIKSLFNCGIRCIVNLMEEHETNHDGEPFAPYENLFEDMAARAEVAVSLIRHPIRDLDVPSQYQMVRTLNAIDEAIDRELPVYVHCWGGVGRTGIVVGCYLMRHGLARADDVLDQIAGLRRNELVAHRRSPETLAQRLMVQAWGRGRWV